MSPPKLCEVFRSPKKEGMYLYVDRAEGLNRVPEALLQAFGKPESALILKLSEERPLARADARTVLDALASEGFYLQMPPGPGTRDEAAPTPSPRSDIEDNPHAHPEV